MELYKNYELSKEATVLYLGHNSGPRYFFESRIYEKYFKNIPLIFTDPDLDFDDLDPNFVTKLFNLSRKYKVAKVGPALQIPELHEMALNTIQHPENPEIECTIAEWESQFWTNSLEQDVYGAGIDTTLHFFNPEYFADMSSFYKAIRVSSPGIIIKHLPWYINNPLCTSEEKEFYIANKTYGWWS